MTPHIETITIDPSTLCVPSCDMLRYSGCREQSDERLCALSREVYEELVPLLTPMAICTRVQVRFQGDVADFGYFRTESRSLHKFLGGDCTAILFAATVGLGADRLIAKYSPILPSRAVIADGCATAAIECLCDHLCSSVFGVAPSARFSPGYGDLPLKIQGDILSLVQAHLKIGLSMTDSMMLTPTKSVTAIVKAKD